jgi:hypothetical protein
MNSGQDDCGVCYGGNADQDCNGDCFGEALEDSCGVCSGGNSGHEADSDQDCNGDCFGEALEDSCGVCSGGNSGHEADSDIDCNGDCFGSAALDSCDVCSGGNSGHEADSDIDCAGDCFGVYLDAGLSLEEGNNLVSFHAMPDNSSLSGVFDGVDLMGVIGEGSAAASIDGTWYGSLDAVDAASGYWVQSNADGAVDVCGHPSDDVEYTLHDANNLLSYAYADSQSIGDALPDAVEDEVFAIVGEGVASINLGGMWAGSLNSFDAGSGYWFARQAGASDITFQYNAPGAGDARLLSNALPVVPEEYVYTQSTSQGFYFVENVMIDGEPMNENNWIVAYNDDVIVGARMWNGEYTDIPAMGYDGSTETAGYMEAGLVPTFKMLDAEGSLIDLYVDGSIVDWKENGVDVITLTTQAPLPVEITLNNSYPNPFNPSTTISFSIPSDMNVDLAVYDISGRLVGELMSGVQTQGLYEITWDANNYASGLYIVRLVAGAEMHTQKIMLVK